MTEIQLFVYHSPISFLCLWTEQIIHYLPLGPVELLEHRLEIFHGSICDEHDGLIAQAALPIRCGLAKRNSHTESVCVYVCV